MDSMFLLHSLAELMLPSQLVAKDLLPVLVMQMGLTPGIVITVSI